jgi:AcrR family transcriptional regulator
MATATKTERDLARHIARVAARLFAERGYHATPVRVIAEEAGVAKPTLYHYFGSKEGLAQAVLTVPLARLVDSLRVLLDEPADPLRRLVAMAGAYLEFSREDPDRARFVHGLFFGPKGPGPAAELVQFADALDLLLAAAVDRATEAGLVSPEQGDACTTALRGLITIQVMDFLYRGRKLGPDLASRLVRDLIRGYGQPAARRAVGCASWGADGSLGKEKIGVA